MTSLGLSANINLGKPIGEFSEYQKLLKEFEPEQFDALLDGLSDQELYELKYDLQYQGRPKQQLPPGDWFTWLILSGRGFGKTFVGAKVIGEWAKRYDRIAIIGDDLGEVKDTMVEGESGILAMARPDFFPHWDKKHTLEYPNGSKVLCFSGREPESLRGPNNAKAWIDELFKFRYQQGLWDELLMTMRSGDNPQVLITSTPRPTALCRQIEAAKDTVVTRGTTYENYALSKKFLDNVVTKYEGTRRGRQEIYGEMLDDNPGALWKLIDIERARLKDKDNDGRAWFSQMDRIVVGVDPATTSNEETSDATGIIVAGRKGDQGYVFSDDTLVATPSTWAQTAIDAYDKWQADRIVAETNNGGDLVETIIRNIEPSVAYKKVHASRGKAIRAEPVAALYEQGRVHHVGYFSDLETEMLEFDPLLGRNQKSPNRMDALVWAMTELFGDQFNAPRIIDLDDY
jgi:phage terminase large subunit-like protein